MNFTRLSEDFAVSPQIQPDDVAFLAEQGFTAIICNRPDDEDAGQPTSDSIREACEQHGIDFHMIPMQGRHVSPETLSRFHAVTEHASGPVLGYCRSGTRSAILWQIASETPTPL